MNAIDHAAQEKAVLGATGDSVSLRFALTIVAEIAPEILLQKRDRESTIFYPITGGRVSGDVVGTVLPGGGDWATARSDQTMNVEARYQFATESGAIVDVFNVGVLRHCDPDAAVIDYFVTAPVFRTAEPRLQWLTRSAFVGNARELGGDIVIDVYEVVTDAEERTHAG
ncbi:DUF3237 domain-containing protein [Leifsonia sp. YAF41]|uniref:DUF3237 domain-containing protein n=1 Tax=Leifsonia sp. YAF41 TaxID=3233086 RepID=UPI003F9518F0